MTTLAEPSLALEPRPLPGAPSWFEALQRDAWEEFRIEPYPVRTDEAWRFSGGVKALTLENYEAADEYPGNWNPSNADGLLQPAGRLVFANERLVGPPALLPGLAEKGVRFLSFDEALRQLPDLLQQHFMAQPARLGSKKFAALHKAMVRSGSVLVMPPGLEINEPFEVLHYHYGEGAAIFPHTLIIAGPGSRATLIDRFRSVEPEQIGLAIGVNDLVVQDGANLTYVSVQEWGRAMVSVQVNATVVGRDAAAINLALNLGGKYSRLESQSRMAAPGARSDMLSISVADDKQEFDQRTLQDHLQPSTTSDLLYKNALDSEAKTIFSGLIKVERGAHRTDAYQKVRNLLLSDDAEADSMPGLEILADEVRCTHGATSGQVEPEELFYLRSRGISEEGAKKLIVRGFLHEVLERLQDKAVIEALEPALERRLRAG
jgi:Fe-S cluster assembly protein SufD